MKRAGRVLAMLGMSLMAAAAGAGAARAADALPHPSSFRANAWDICTQLLGADGAYRGCDDAVAHPLGRADDAGQLTGRLLLRFGTVTLMQTSPIQDAQLELHVVNQQPYPPVRVLVHRVTEHWAPGAPVPQHPSWDPEPLATAVPDADGRVVFDLAWLADAWHRHHVTHGREGLWNTGLLVRLEHEPLTGGCNPVACPALEVAARNLDVAMRPAFLTRSWPHAPWEAGIHARPDDATGRRVRLATSSPSDWATAATFQYLVGERATWRTIPAAALSDAAGAPVDDAARPLDRIGASGERWTEVYWDVTASPGGDRDGMVRVRALHHTAPSSWIIDGGATGEATFRVGPEPPVEEPPGEDLPGEDPPGEDLPGEGPPTEGPPVDQQPPYEQPPIQQPPLPGPAAAPASAARAPAPTNPPARRPGSSRRARARPRSAARGTAPRGTRPRRCVRPLARRAAARRAAPKRPSTPRCAPARTRSRRPSR